MSKIAILTDSSCDIPQEMAEKYGIDIMSFHILLDNVDYVERESCTNTEFYDKMRAAKGVPSTAAITPIQFCEKYCQYVDEGYSRLCSAAKSVLLRTFRFSLLSSFMAFVVIMANFGLPLLPRIGNRPAVSDPQPLRETRNFTHADDKRVCAGRPFYFSFSVLFLKQ